MYKLLYALCGMILLYIAALYSSFLLIGFVLGMFFVACFLYASTWIFKKNSSLVIQNNPVLASKEEKIIFSFTLHVSSFIQPSLIRYFIRIQYNNEKAIKKHVDSTSVNSPLFSGQMCGIFKITLDSISIYDWTRLFHRRQTFKNTTCDIVVLPDPIPLICPVLNQNIVFQGNDEKRVVFQGNENSMEIKDLREYQAQDSLKHIHWKQSARLQKYYVKEYEKEQGTSLVAKIDFKEGFTSNDLQFSYSILLGLLQQQIQLTCQIEDTSYYVFSITSKEDIDLMFVSYLTKQATAFSSMDNLYDLRIYHQECFDSYDHHLPLKQGE